VTADPHRDPWSLRDQALAYAASGVPVFPCVPGGKTPLTTRGFHDATTDDQRIRAWWAWRPQANIATPTGTPGFDVLDVDVRDTGDGWDGFQRAERAGLLDGWVRSVRTPSGGLHLHYPGNHQRNGTIRGQHLDFRGTGGYVLLPPSLGQTKTYRRRYQLQRVQPGPGRPFDWDAIVRLLTAAPAPRNKPAATRTADDPTPRLAAHVARQPEGNRNNALFWAACRAAEAGINDLRPLVEAAVTAGLPAAQATRTVHSSRRTVTGSTAGTATFRVPLPTSPTVLAR